ncbi:hypothetical protein A5695_12315 [Mycobacterium sp. E1747]|nr:hypothetical protein A5695_12315 [Mycobacterium sp. E1747]
MDVDVDVVGLALLDELHPAMDIAVTPATVRTANRVSGGVGKLAGIEILQSWWDPTSMGITSWSCS